MRLRDRRKSSTTWTQADNDAPAAVSSGSEFDATEAVVQTTGTAPDEDDEMEEDELDEDDLVENITSAVRSSRRHIFSH